MLVELIHHQLNEGINLYLYETEKFNTITAKVFIQNNLAEESVAANALIPMILRRGSQKYPTSFELASKMEYLYGSALGADVMKIGERQILEFYFDMVAPHLLPDGESVLLDGFQTFGELITNPILEGAGFKQEYFEQERANLGKMVDGLINDKRAYAFWRAISSMCKDEPYGLYRYGQREQIDRLNNEEVYKQYCEILACCPIDIFVVGPDLSLLPELINSWKWNRRSLKTLAQITDKAVIKPQEIREKRDVQQTILVMGYRTNQRYLSEDYYALLVANGVLGVFPHSKLFINVRERASLAYYVGSTLEGTKGLMVITAGIAEESYDQAVDIINQQLMAVQNGDITNDELNQTKIGLISGIRSMVDNPASIIDRNVLGIVNNHLRSPEEVMKRIAAVTKEQAQKAAQKIQLDTIYFLSGGKGEQ